MLVRKVNPHTGKLSWALISRTTRRVLQWFGSKKPSKEAVAKVERRVQFFKHQG